MTIKPEDEERIRHAGKLVNDKLKFFEKEFGIEDKGELLAMVALDSMIKKLAVDEAAGTVSSTVEDKIEALNLMVKSALF